VIIRKQSTYPIQQGFISQKRFQKGYYWCDLSDRVLADASQQGLDFSKKIKKGNIFLI